MFLLVFWLSSIT